MSVSVSNHQPSNATSNTFGNVIFKKNRRTLSTLEKISSDSSNTSMVKKIFDARNMNCPDSSDDECSPTKKTSVLATQSLNSSPISRSKSPIGYRITSISPKIVERKLTEKFNLVVESSPLLTKDEITPTHESMLSGFDFNHSTPSNGINPEKTIKDSSPNNIVDVPELMTSEIKKKPMRKKSYRESYRMPTPPMRRRSEGETAFAKMVVVPSNAARLRTTSYRDPNLSSLSSSQYAVTSPKQKTNDQLSNHDLEDFEVPSTDYCDETCVPEFLWRRSSDPYGSHDDIHQNSHSRRKSSSRAIDRTNSMDSCLPQSVETTPKVQESCTLDFFNNLSSMFSSLTFSKN